MSRQTVIRYPRIGNWNTNAADWAGKRIGTVSVLSRHGSVKLGPDSSHSAWLCRCDCGRETIKTNSWLQIRTKRESEGYPHLVYCAPSCPLKAKRIRIFKRFKVLLKKRGIGI